MIRVAIGSLFLFGSFYFYYSHMGASTELASREVAQAVANWNVSIENVKISAPITELFRGRDAMTSGEGEADALESEMNEKSVDGELSFTSANQPFRIPIKISVRGQTSQYDCSFSKLKIKWKSPSVQNTPLQGLNGWRINTHCSAPTQSGYTEMGRVAGERGPVREHMVYKIQEALGLPHLKSRLAKVTYEDTNGKNSNKAYALILENNKNLESRVRAKIIEEDDLKQDDAPGSAELTHIFEKRRDKVLDLAFFQSLIANFDFGLRVADLQGKEYFFRPEPPGFHNMALLLREGQSSELLASDFDVAGFVTQKNYVISEEDKSFTQCSAGVCLEQFVQLQRWRSFFPKKVWEQKKAEWQASGKPRILALIEEHPALDEKEKHFFRRSIQTFDYQLSNLFKASVVTKADTVEVFANMNSAASCGQENPEESITMTLPPGTPVFLLQRGNQRSLVKVYEVYMKSMTNPFNFHDCLVNDGKVWIRNEDLSAISKDWPQQ